MLYQHELNSSSQWSLHFVFLRRMALDLLPVAFAPFHLVLAVWTSFGSHSQNLLSGLAKIIHFSYEFPTPAYLCSLTWSSCGLTIQATFWSVGMTCLILWVTHYSLICSFLADFLQQEVAFETAGASVVCDLKA